MTIQQAEKIKENYSIFLEQTFPSLNSFFFGFIPEGFLPYKRSVINDALNVIKKVAKDQKNNDYIEALDGGLEFLKFFYDNDFAFDQFGNKTFKIHNMDFFESFKQLTKGKQAEQLKYLLKISKPTE